MIVSAIVRNYAALPQTNITVSAEITGTQTITLTGIITDTIDVYKSDTVFLRNNQYLFRRFVNH
ncbi:MAG: hypothetical protein IPP29_18385 [Bacteroidetes bacterium]|nr:hypothetical protein [Bacteroidota bacterium]